MAQTLTTEIITAAIEGFEAQKARIDEQIAELRGILSGVSTGSNPATAPSERRRRRISVAGKARIAEAQRKRWAALKGRSAASPETAKPKRRLSAAGRKNIVDALRRRWAAKRAQSATSQP